jgi:DNA polymerase-3 subunit beta
MSGEWPSVTCRLCRRHGNQGNYDAVAAVAGIVKVNREPQPERIDGLKTLVRVASNRRSTLPILSYILFENGRVRASDLDVWAECQCDLAGANAPVAIHAATIHAARTVRPELTLDGERLNGIKADLWQSEAGPVADFPVLDMEGFALDADCVIQPADLSYVAAAMSKDDVRYYLNGALFDFAAGALVATDGHRLHMVNSGRAVPAKPAGGERDKFIVPQQLIHLATAATKREPIRFSFYVKGEGRGAPQIVVAIVGGLRLAARCVDGTYPAYDKVIPDADTPARAMVSVPGLRDALKVARPIMKLQKTKGVYLTAGAIEFADESAPVRFALSGKYDQKWKTGVNFTYLEDALVGLEGDVNLRQQASEDTRTFALRIGDGERFAIIMPMNV